MIQIPEYVKPKEKTARLDRYQEWIIGEREFHLSGHASIYESVKDAVAVCRSQLDELEWQPAPPCIGNGYGRAVFRLSQYKTASSLFGSRGIMKIKQLTLKARRGAEFSGATVISAQYGVAVRLYDENGSQVYEGVIAQPTEWNFSQYAFSPMKVVGSKFNVELENVVGITLQPFICGTADFKYARVDSGEVVLKVDFYPIRTIIVKITDAVSGQPVTNAKVDIIHGDELIESKYTGSDGTASFELIGEATYTVRVQVGDIEPYMTTVNITTSMPDPDYIFIRIPSPSHPTHYLTLEFRDKKTGMPVVPTKIVLRGDLTGFETSPEPNSSITLKLPEDTYTLSVEAVRYAKHVEKITLDSDKTVTVYLTPVEDAFRNALIIAVGMGGAIVGGAYLFKKYQAKKGVS